MWMTQTLAYWYSAATTQVELSNEYQHDRLDMVSIHVFWTEVALALEGFKWNIIIDNQLLRPKCLRVFSCWVTRVGM